MPKGDPRIKKIMVERPVPSAIPGNPYRDKMPKRPVGRPKGSKNVYSKHSASRLRELHYDPIQEMIQLQREVDAAMYDLTHDSDGNIKAGYSAIAYAQLSAVKKDCINNLMRYGYARTPEGNEVKTGDLKPITINLTNQNYLPGESGAIDAIDLVIANNEKEKEEHKTTQ